jgi:hypothetical protein
MQRRIVLWIAVVVAVMFLAGGAGLLAYRSYKQNLPAPVWVPLPINPQLPDAKRDEIIEKLRKELAEPAILDPICKELGLARAWELPTDAAAADRIRQRMFVRAGEADTPMGKVPAIHFGMNGINKERDLSGRIAVRMMDDVFKLLDIKPPPKQ